MLGRRTRLDPADPSSKAPDFQNAAVPEPRRLRYGFDVRLNFKFSRRPEHATCFINRKRAIHCHRPPPGITPGVTVGSCRTAHTALSCLVCLWRGRIPAIHRAGCFYGFCSTSMTIAALEAAGQCPSLIRARRNAVDVNGASQHIPTRQRPIKRVGPGLRLPESSAQYLSSRS